MQFYTTSRFSIFFGDQATSFAPQEFYGCQHEAAIRNSPQFVNALQQLASAHIAVVKQVHGTDGLVIQRVADVPARPYATEGDYLITTVPQVGLAIATADCLPMIIYDPVRHVAAAVHAGWRGSVAGIAEKVLQEMQARFGSQPEDQHLFFGPSAGACCYEVDAQFVQALPESGPFVIRREGRMFFDTALYNQCLLQRCGVKTFIKDYWQCTICSPHFCSYRRDGAASKRQMTIVSLRAI